MDIGRLQPSRCSAIYSKIGLGQPEADKQPSSWYDTLYLSRYAYRCHLNQALTIRQLLHTNTAEFMFFLEYQVLIETTDEMDFSEIVEDLKKSPSDASGQHIAAADPPGSPGQPILTRYSTYPPIRCTEVNCTSSEYFQLPLSKCEKRVTFSEPDDLCHVSDHQRPRSEGYPRPQLQTSTTKWPEHDTVDAEAPMFGRGAHGDKQV